MLVIIASIFIFTSTVSSSFDVDNDHFRSKRSLLITDVSSPYEMAVANGFSSAATHYVKTEDGYILAVDRIPRGRNEISSSASKPVVLLMHCLMCSSADWLMNTPEDALGFNLADNGYDVWMGNSRGNVYTKNHTTLSTKSRRFWDFSVHEIAIYDVTATIDYIIATTGVPKIHYVGYSMGVVAYWIMMSEKPEYNDKILSAAMLGPPHTLRNNGGLIFRFTPFVNIIESFAKVFNINELSGQNILINALSSTLCSPVNAHLNPLCLFVFSIMIDIDSQLVNQEYLPTIFSHMPAGGSLKSVLHFMQMKRADRFQQYDYGPRVNYHIYGATLPKEYNLNNVKTPVALFYGQADKYVPPSDVLRLAGLLPNVALTYRIPHPLFSHFDFLWAKGTTNLLNRELLEFLNKYN